LFGVFVACIFSCMKRSLLAPGLVLIAVLSVSAARATPEDTAYIRVVTERAGKIVASLSLPDSTQFLRVRTIVVNQYRNLNAIYMERDDRLKQLKSQQPAPDKNAVDSVKSLVQQNADAQVAQLHSAYLRQLAMVLNTQQIDKVKDGMTYNVLEVTYRVYQEELPDLTDAQKAYILASLTEAREHAMDGGTSKEKHAWFGKYKGRINNYLSSQGIDMKK